MKEVRVVAPSLSLKATKKEALEKVREYFQRLGYTLTEGNYLYERDDIFGIASIEKRVSDLMEAYKDPNVEIILCADGGYNVNQILPYLDYTLIAQNPKMIIGYSDITALLVAIMAKTKQITYYGPMVTGFSMDSKYNQENFEKMLRKETNKIEPAEIIIDYSKEKPNNKIVEIKNEGFYPVQPGTALGSIVGGNLCTLNLLQGTAYMPSLKDVILFIEDDADDFISDTFFLEFDRNLESLLQVIDCRIKGIVLGRFQLCSQMTLEKLKTILASKEKLRNIPIVANVNFGHTNPMITLPLGGKCHLEVSDQTVKLEISNA